MEGQFSESMTWQNYGTAWEIQISPSRQGTPEHALDIADTESQSGSSRKEMWIQVEEELEHRRSYDKPPLN
jgi:hypothetical protein